MRQNWQRSLIMRCTVTVVLSVLPTAPPGFSTLNFTTFCTSAALFTLFLFSSQFDESVIAEITEPFEMTAERRRRWGAGGGAADLISLSLSLGRERITEGAIFIFLRLA